MPGRVTTLVGAQFGSEGKGVVAYEIANEYGIHVRTGAPNAGHSFVHEGKVWKMQAVPCGWANKNAKIVLGPGALINLKILARELDAIGDVDPSIYDRFYIDPRAGILESRHHEEEGGTGGELHARIGSTGEGVGAARLDKFRRDENKFRQIRHLPDSTELCGHPISKFVRDIPTFLSEKIISGVDVLLEGTQGFGLSITHGEWPYVTTSDTISAQLAADAGVPPQFVTHCILVVRTHPIRVAGPSGPLKNEISWEDMSEKLGRDVVEHTTVTKKPRRIGEWDEDIVRRSIVVNGATEIALTFVDYIAPSDRDQTDWTKLSDTTYGFINYLESMFDVPVTFVGTGFDEKEGWRFIRREVTYR